MSKTSGYIAAQHLRWGDGHLSPGDPVPQDPARDYGLMVRTGQIVRGEPAASKPEPGANGEGKDGGEDLDALTVRELRERLVAAGVEPDGLEGSGADGTVVKADFVNALGGR